MFAKQTIWSASLVALCGAAQVARAEDDLSAQRDGEVRPRQLPPDPPPQPIPEPRGTFQVGAGFSTDESFIAAATISQPDLFRTGSLLMMHAQISAKRRLLLTRFADPDVLGSPVGLSFDVYSDRRQLPGFIRTGTGGALTTSLRIARHLRSFVSYRLEQVDVESRATSSLRTIEPLPPLAGGLISSVRAGIVYDSTGGAAAPVRGSEVGTATEIADRRLGSNLSFVKTDAWLRHHQPIGPLTLHLAGSFSTIGSFTQPGASVPRSERLFLTSSQELRGYRSDSFGPLDAFGTPIGGNAKVLGSIELEVPLVRRIGLSVFGFADAGGLLAAGQGQLGASTGVGLLWRSPIGPLKLSWALPIDGAGPVFGFGIGSGF